MSKKELKNLSNLISIRPQRAAKSAAIKSLKDCIVPLNVKMRNMNNCVWSNVTTVEKEQAPEKAKQPKKTRAVLQPIVKPVANKKERGDKENKPKKPSKVKMVEKRRPNVRSASVAREPLASKKIAHNIRKTRAASQS